MHVLEAIRRACAAPRIMDLVSPKLLGRFAKERDTPIKTSFIGRGADGASLPRRNNLVRDRNRARKREEST